MMKRLMLGLFLLGLLQVFPAKGAEIDTALIMFKLEDAKPTDTVELIYYPDMLSNQKKMFLKQRQWKVLPDRDGLYNFRIDSLENIGYFTLRRKIAGKGVFTYYEDFLDSYLIFPGDSVSVSFERIDFSRTEEGYPLQVADNDLKYIFSFEKYHVSFSGEQSLKYRIRYDMDKVSSRLFNPERSVMNPDGSVNGRNDDDLCREAGLTILEAHKRLLSDDAYNLLKADLLGKWYLQKLQHYIFATSWAEDEEPFDRDNVNKNLLDINCFPEPQDLEIPDRIAATSRFFPEYVLWQLMARNKVDKRKDKTFDDICNDDQGLLKERLLTQYLLQFYEATEGVSAKIDSAISLVKKPVYAQILQDLREAIGVGQEAYNFQLVDKQGKIVRLDDFRGKVVFLDFWYTGCTGCADFYAEKLHQLEKDFSKDARVRFISVSIDRTYERWQYGVKSGKYTSDEYVLNLFTEGKGANHPVIANYKITAYPHMVLIDKEGRIAGTHIFGKSSTELSTWIKSLLK